jgi:hypothetical protein
MTFKRAEPGEPEDMPVFVNNHYILAANIDGK